MTPEQFEQLVSLLQAIKNDLACLNTVVIIYVICKAVGFIK